MIESLSESPTVLLAGVVVLVLGALIKYREWTFLIAGYDASSDVPESVAADVVGNLAIRIGVLTVALGILAAVRSLPTVVAIVVGAVVVLDAGRSIYRLQTYEPGAA